jgi:hypothetical protein
LSLWASRHSGVPIEFHIYGSGPLKAVIEKLQTPPNLIVSVRGPLRNADISTAFAAAGIFVLPTLADEWGVVVQEALVAGLPVLGSVYSAAVEELIVDGENGWVFEPDDPESVEDALRRCLTTDETKLAGMRTRARASGLRINSESVAAEVARAIQYSLGSRHGRPQLSEEQGVNAPAR